jgi:alpha-L-fucosidase
MHPTSKQFMLNQKITFLSQRLLKLAAVIGCCALAIGNALAGDAGPANSYLSETPAQHNARMEWFREARFGMFIHWGLYSEAAGSWDGKPTDGAGEWIMNNMQIPVSQYAKLVPQFNPVKFDAKAWVQLAKNAGMKYIVITSKHHEGFDMYPSTLTDWCIKSTPFQRDPLKELSVACHEAGIKLCFYYSIMDWHHPDYLPRKSWNDEANPNPDFERYVAYMKGQLKELLTGYGPIGLIWFDGNWEKSWNYDRGLDLYNYIRGIQPDLIVNNRVGQDKNGIAGTTDGQERVGDYGTPEQTIPANGFGPGVDWETCMTMNDTWGYKRQDQNWKSTQTLIRNLVDIASKGGNYLLNVGPTGEGLIPKASVERLNEIGQWMSVNGEAIHATTASPFERQLPWGRCTKKIENGNTTLYLHVFDWPADGKLFVPGLKSRAESVFMLASATTSLNAETDEDGTTIFLPPAAPDKISSTVVLNFAGAPEIVDVPIFQNPDGSIVLPAGQARLHGSAIQYESGGSHDNIGYWFHPADWADWDFKVNRPGKFIVTAEIATPALTSFELSVAGQTFRCAAPVTENFDTFQTVTLASFEISTPGTFTVAVHPIKGGWQPMNLKSIELKPVAANP